MSNSWAIIIGINQYQGFQPLTQAQNDAVAIRKYLIEDAGFAAENCILLSDLSTSIEQEAVYPDRTALNDWLKRICQERVQQDDILWFFFSGYGAQADNRDYLMPVDGDPAQVMATGIALQDVLKHLQQAPASEVMLVLDINRSMSALPGQAIGSQITKLAQKANIPLMLSCQPDQFSHETLGLRHGIFTAALLEGLRYDGCATLSHLERYLVERVPELSEHHWRPIQDPVIVLPEEQKFQLLWHQRTPSDVGIGTETPIPPSVPFGDLTDSEPLINTEDTTDYGADDLIPDNPDGADDFMDTPGSDLLSEPGSDLVTEPSFDFLSEEDDYSADEESRYPYGLDIDNREIDNPDNATDGDADDYGTTLVDDVPDEPIARKSKPLSCLGLLLGLFAFLLLAVYVLRNQPAVQNTLEQVPPEWLANVGLSPDEEADGNALPDNPDGESSSSEESPTDEEAPNPEQIAAEAPDGEEETEETVDDEEPSSEPEAGVTPDNPDAGQGESSVDGAAVEAGNGDTAAVSAVGNSIPGSNNVDTAAVLAEARRSLNPSQASQFASAIATARQIPSDDPNYEVAQADIRRWSQVILDLAEGRAAETQLQAAIDAATLVPREPADIYQQAQERIEFWQDRAATREFIREAQTIPRMGQASTYQRGILKLQEVPSNQPIEYADAQRLIDEWTEKMLMIAQARAAQGRYSSAIEAAALIPANTPNYDQAQAEIKRWQDQ
ncbi:MAG: caspase family protein [Cyanobacteria bacterium P01_D01_bin.156]